MSKTASFHGKVKRGRDCLLRDREGVSAAARGKPDLRQKYRHPKMARECSLERMVGPCAQKPRKESL